jgi:hypothetical protein
MQGKELTPANTWKREFVHERSQTAAQMMAIMMMVCVVSLFGAIFAFIKFGWFPALTLLILASIAYGLSRLFDLIGDLFDSTDGRGTAQRQRQSTDQLPADEQR